MRSIDVPSSPPSHRWRSCATTAEKLSRILASSFFDSVESSRRIGEFFGLSGMMTYPSENVARLDGRSLAFPTDRLGFAPKTRRCENRTRQRHRHGRAGVEQVDQAALH